LEPKLILTWVLKLAFSLW